VRTESQTTHIESQTRHARAVIKTEQKVRLGICKQRVRLGICEQRIRLSRESNWACASRESDWACASRESAQYESRRPVARRGSGVQGPEGMNLSEKLHPSAGKKCRKRR
jgi:hypothetical protein